MKAINLVFLILLISAFLIIGFVTRWQFLSVTGFPNQVPLWLVETGIFIGIIASSIAIYKSLFSKNNVNDDPKPQPIENTTANASNGGTASTGDNNTNIHYNGPVTIIHTQPTDSGTTPAHSNNESSLPTRSSPITSTIAPHGMPNTQAATHSRDTLQYDAVLKQHNEPKPGAIQINPQYGAQMVYVPAGEFLMGGDEYDDERPPHTVNIDSYWIYKTPVTVAQYRAFCQASERDMPPAPSWGWQDSHPMVNVNWNDAQAYATWAGAALPTEAQWEKAARGINGRVYPWGNDWDEGKLQCSKKKYGDAERTAPVGSYPAGASPYGCLDISGNVCEWCADRYDKKYYQHAPTSNPTGPATGMGRSLRGGSWNTFDPRCFRAASRLRFYPPVRNSSFGFRCIVRLPGL